LVVADDLDVPLFESLDRLPSLDAGRRFERAFVTTPLCCPSKVSMLRGQYAHSHGVRSNDPPNGGHAAALEHDIEACTVATWLHGAGYRTGFIGRYLVGYGWRDSEPSHVPPGWDHWMARISRTAKGYQDVSFSVNGVERTIPGNTDAVALDQARTFIADAGESPYFLMIATMGPHGPWGGGPNPGDPARRLSTMGPVEDLVASLLAETREDTYLIFTSDNGFHLEPEPGKSLPYDSDTHVPLVVWGPGVAAGGDDRIVANIDLAPTISELAGVVPPDFVEGASLVPLLDGGEVVWRDRITLEYVGRWSAVRTTDTLTIDWADGQHEEQFHDR
jgi:arylsulfatase A-like enzyme